MTLILTGVVLIAFLTGLAIGTARGHEDRECLRRACRKLLDRNTEIRKEAADYEDRWWTVAQRLVEADRLNKDLRHENAQLRAEVFDRTFRAVDPETAERVMAEWITKHDPRYHETETE